MSRPDGRGTRTGDGREAVPPSEPTSRRAGLRPPGRSPGGGEEASEAAAARCQRWPFRATGGNRAAAVRRKPCARGPFRDRRQQGSPPTLRAFRPVPERSERVPAGWTERPRGGRNCHPDERADEPESREALQGLPGSGEEASEAA